MTGHRGCLVWTTSTESRMDANKPKVRPLSQQRYLQKAMEQAGLTEEELARKLGTDTQYLLRFLMPTGSADFREMNDDVWKLVREIVEADRKGCRES